jgi:hypothetical protein
MDAMVRIYKPFKKLSFFQHFSFRRFLSRAMPCRAVPSRGIHFKKQHSATRFQIVYTKYTNEQPFPRPASGSKDIYFSAPVSAVGWP